jgi:hypothetical protein
MRELKQHIVEGDSANHQVTVVVMDEPGAGGACHEYQIVTRDPLYLLGSVSFQNGPIKEFGVNGVTHEALLAILIDRLESFQRGPYACGNNAAALSCCKHALDVLQDRTRARIARNVEGTTQK